jgi:hypothetical protein
MNEPRSSIFELGESFPLECFCPVNALDLHQYLDSRDRSKHRIILLEETHPQSLKSTTADEYSPCPETCYACLLRQSLDVPERFFLEHEKQNVTFAFNENIHVPKLPSRLHPSNSFHLSYFDLRTFKGDPSSISFQCPVTKQYLCPGSDGDLKLVCSRTGREIQCHEWQNKKRGTLFIVPRKCSFWIREYSEGGWDGN